MPGFIEEHMDRWRTAAPGTPFHRGGRWWTVTEIASDHLVGVDGSGIHADFAFEEIEHELTEGFRVVHLCDEHCPQGGRP